MDERVHLTRMQRLEQQEDVLRAKIDKLHKQLREVEAKKRALRNTEIVRMVKALRIPRDQLYDFLKNQSLPVLIEKTTDYESEDMLDEEQSN